MNGVLQLERADAALRPLVPTTLRHPEVDWRDVAQALATQQGLLVALLVLDQGEQSEALRQMLRDRWLDLDRAGGDQVALLVPSLPGDAWLSPLRRTLQRLDPGLRQVVHDDTRTLSTARGRAQTDRALDALAREHLPEAKLPALVLFEFQAVHTEPEAWWVELAGERLDAVLGRLAQAVAKRPAGVGTEWVFQRLNRERAFRGTLQRLLDALPFLKAIKGLSK